MTLIEVDLTGHQHQNALIRTSYRNIRQLQGYRSVDDPAVASTLRDAHWFFLQVRSKKAAIRL